MTDSRPKGSDAILTPANIVTLVRICLVPVFGFLPACFASPLAWICADLFLVPAFGQCLKKLKRTFGE